MLYNNGTYEKISDFLKKEHFSNKNHLKIYEAISFLIESGQTADPITLNHYLSKTNSYTQKEQTAYLNKLIESVVPLVKITSWVC